MALSANTVVEVRAAGNDTNGGGFVTGASGADYSQTNDKRTGQSSNNSATDVVANGTTTITSATDASWSTGIVGNIIYLQGGSGGLAAGWYQVTAYTNIQTITVDRTVPAGTGITMNIGGALASLGMAGGIGLVSGSIIWVRAASYSVTSATPNVSGGCFSTSNVFIQIEGYSSTRGDLGTRPVLTASGISTFTLVTMTGADSMLRNLSFDGAGLTSSRGVVVRGTVQDCHFEAFTNNAVVLSSSLTVVNCSATACTTAPAFTTANYVDCVAYANLSHGFAIAGVGYALVRCLAAENDDCGFSVTGQGSLFVNCTAWGSTDDGFVFSDDNHVLVNCVSDTNGNADYDLGSRANVTLVNCAYGPNSGGTIVNAAGKGVALIDTIVGTQNFFADALNGDFAPNNLAGGGALLRAAGVSGPTYYGGTGYLDVGVLQSACAAAASLPFRTQSLARRTR